jgi:manganese transport protein
MCSEHFAPPVVYTMWLASEIAAMATELAELLGASLGLTLLCGTPLLASMLLVGIVTYAALHLQRCGFRSVEILIACFVGVIVVSYLIELMIAPPHWGAVAVVRLFRVCMGRAASLWPWALSAPRSCRTPYTFTPA